MIADLIAAIKSGDAILVEKLLMIAPSLAKGTTDEGISLIMLACYYGQPVIAKVIANQKKILDCFEATAIGQLTSLQDHIAQHPEAINTFAKDGFTILGLASFFEHTEIVKYLLTAGADVNLPSNNNFKVAPIHSAAARKNTEMASLLIQGGANVNAQQMSGVRPLHSAAHLGDLAMVKLLLANGANVQVNTNEGKSPLQMAEEGGFIEVVDYLKEYNVDS